MSIHNIWYDWPLFTDRNYGHLSSLACKRRIISYYREGKVKSGKNEANYISNSLTYEF